MKLLPLPGSPCSSLLGPTPKSAWLTHAYPLAISLRPPPPHLACSHPVTLSPRLPLPLSPGGLPSSWASFTQQTLAS